MDILTKILRSRLFSIIAILATATSVVKLAQFTKDLVIASRFGTSDALDAYLIAFAIPAFCINVFAGPLNSVLIPIFSKLQYSQGRDAVEKFLWNATAWIALLTTTTAILSYAISPYLIDIIAPTFNLEKRRLAHTLLLVTLPTIVLGGIGNTWAAILYSDKKSVFPALTPIISPIITILLIALFGNVLGAYALALGAVGGLSMEVALLTIGLKKAGYCVNVGLPIKDTNIREAARHYIPIVTSSVFMAGIEIVNQSMASTIGVGGVATFNYGTKLVAFAMGLAGVAIGSAALPYFSEMAAAGKWRDIKRTINIYGTLVLILLVPTTIILYLFSEWIVRIVYQRGAFTNEATIAVAKVQALYVLQLPFHIVGIVLVRVLASLQKTGLLVSISLINLLTVISLNYLFIPILGVAGIALSTSLMYIATTIVIYVACLNILTRIIADSTTPAVQP